MPQVNIFIGKPAEKSTANCEQKPANSKFFSARRKASLTGVYFAIDNSDDIGRTKLSAKPFVLSLIR